MKGPQRGMFGQPRAVDKGGEITLATLARLLTLLAGRTDYPHHVEVSVTVGPIVKTIDNERDALETVRRLETKTINQEPPR